MPFHSSTHLIEFDRQRDPSDMDLLIFLNGKPLKQALLESSFVSHSVLSEKK